MWKRYVVALPLALASAVWFFFLTLPWPVALRWQDPRDTALMEQRAREARAGGETLELRHEWVSLDRISPNLRRAVLVAEDARFREHSGIDWNAIREELRYQGSSEFSWTDPADLRAALDAMRYYARNRDRVRGRSTITQQVAKNLYLSADRSLIRKGKELILARRLERFLDKDRILEIYLNIAEWGPGVFGAEAAARHYFGVSAAALSSGQAAALAATLPHPLTSNPALRPARMSWRRDLILRRMGASGPVRTVPLAPEVGEEVEDERETGAPLLGDPLRASPPDTTGDSVPTPDTVPPPDTVPALDTIAAPGAVLPPRPAATHDTIQRRGRDQGAGGGSAAAPAITARSIASSREWVASAIRVRSPADPGSDSPGAVETAKVTSPSYGVWAGPIRRATATEAAVASARSAVRLSD